MGNITDRIQHERDVAELRELVETYPVIARYVSHHARNCLAGAIGSIQLNHPKDAMDAIFHLVEDLNSVGL